MEEEGGREGKCGGVMEEGRNMKGWWKGGD